MRSLDDIERDAAAATPGPWICNDMGDIRTENGGRSVAEAGPGPNGPFIANAREDVPAMAKRIRELEARERVLDAVEARLAEAMCEIAELRARLEKYARKRAPWEMT